MIGSFTYKEAPDPDDIAVEICCASDGTRIGQLRLARTIEQALQGTETYPPLRIFPIEAALSYGIFLALKLCLPLLWWAIRVHGIRDGDIFTKPAHSLPLG